MIGFGDQISASYGSLHRRARAALLLTTALSSPLLVGSALAQNLPTGGSVAAGSVAIAQPSATQLNITQTSQSAVVNWQSFSIGQGSAVNIQQPNSTSAMLNRVTGNTPSTIGGSLTANGQVYLINPNGIAITPSGVVNTGGGFVASTLGISDVDFLSGKRTFTGNGASAAVSNAGIIRVGRGGYAALLGGTVSNTGKIFVPLGQVGLGSGESATLDFSGDGFLQVALPTTAGGSGALISNSGTIKAAGGSIIISAATAREAARNAVNISGIVQARTIGGQSGSIFIGGGAGGNVNVTGRLSATGRQGTGGAITVTGKDITLAGAGVDASGSTGGGSVNIGGGRQGHGPLQQADTVTIDSATVIRADATAAGNGGNVVVWSNHLSTFAGTISAHGGALGGNGGEAEVSGKAKLDYSGFTDLSAANGRFGTLLLDPFNVIISGGANNTGGSFDANTNDSIINTATLQAALGGANVTITTGFSGSQAGSITVAAPLTWAAATTLGLNAAGGIAINAPISITGAGGLALNATAQPGVTTTGLTFGNGASVDYGATDNGGSFSLNGVGYTLVYSMAQLDAIDGVNAVDGSGLSAYGAGLAGSYALATSFNAAGTIYTRPLIGTGSSGDATTEFTGQFDGLGHTVTGLTINAPGMDYAALFGFVSGAGASVSNVGLIGGSVIGQNNVGSLAGWLDTGAVVQTSFSSAAVTGTGTTNTGGLIGFNTGTVRSSYAAGPVKGTSATGGLIGWSVIAGTITNSYATGAASGVNYTGGLIGINGSNVIGSYATGAVTGTSLDTGGLIGVLQSGVVSASYATGAVAGSQNTGGLIGANKATVQTSYATGTVKGNGFRTGGLIGQNAGTVQASYATGAVTGTTVAGGLVALNTAAGNVSSSYATGAVTGTDVNVGGLVGNNVGTVSASYSTGTVTGTSVGGLIGANTGTVTSSYWDMQTSGWTTSAGGAGAVGQTTAQLQGALPTSFSSTVWSTGPGLYPYLSWQFPAGTTPQSLSGIAHQANGTALAGAVLAGSVNGAAFAGGTGANGYYYLLLPQGTTALGSGVFIDIAGNAVKSNDYVQGAFGSLQNLDLNAGALNVRTDATALSSLASVLAGVAGGTAPTDLVFSTPGGVLTPKAGTSVSIAASGAFDVDQALVVPNALLLTAAGGLTIGSTGALSSSRGNATLVGSSFVNNAGAAAVSAPDGRWLIYSGDPANDNRGGLAYDFKQYGATYGATAVAQATGNGVLYSVAPTVGLTGTVFKTYDGNTTVAPGSYRIGFTGYDQDVLTLSYSNLVYGDANAGASKTVTANGVAVTSATSGSALVYGYASTTTASGNIGTIAARPLTVTADTQSRIYGNTNPALTYTIGGSGLVNGDTLAGSLSTDATPISVAGPYAITQGTLINALNPNYAIAYAGATLVVSAAVSPSSPAPAATPSASPFIVTTPEPSTPKQASINFQLDQSATAVIAPLAVTPVRVASKPDQTTQTAARQNPDDDIVTGSVTPQAFKSADGFVYKPLSQYDAAQYSGKTLPGFESQAGEAAIFTMLLRGALGLPDTPKIDNLFEPGKGFQWRGANWENPLADKVRVSDGADHTGAPGESFPIKPGTTDLAALLAKRPMILTGHAANAAPLPLLGVTMSEEGIVANDPGTGLQVLLNYNLDTKTLGPVVSVFDSMTKTWTRLADVKPNNDRQSQAQLDQLTTWSGDRFASVSVPHSVP